MKEENISRLVTDLIIQLNPDSDVLLIEALNQKLLDIHSSQINEIINFQFTKSERSNAITGIYKTLTAELVKNGTLKPRKESYRGAYDLPIRERKKLHSIGSKMFLHPSFEEIVNCKIIINRINRKLRPILYKYKNHYATS